ncbi:hypothetical protein AWH48_14730 [Domibacillus aminovorans]|uniref:Uncharacterized protein n=1 Tax=Domibacillus aminovorans TaxID=29332 RepID=A0A177L186_9BACI|nr:hypothetical protein [Domibacillus aminovorans]OAH59393.1 hypothetical protein AWH48_14730 [Domibacillus aminovorans]
MLLHRDCIFYKYSGTPNWRDIENTQQDNFCSFSCESYEQEILTASFEWLDPIKVRDKIITSERKKIKFFVFKNSKVICIFGGSESQIAYTISKLLTFFPISFEKVNIFESYKEQFLKLPYQKGFTLSSIDIAKQQSGFDDSTYINIKIDEIEPVKLAKYISVPEVLSLIIFFEEKQIYFSLDLYSVVSFFDTDEFNSIYEVCKRIVIDIV